jgi:hypothetical protein
MCLAPVLAFKSNVGAPRVACVVCIDTISMGDQSAEAAIEMMSPPLRDALCKWLCADAALPDSFRQRADVRFMDKDRS